MCGTMVWGTVCILIIKGKIKFDIQPSFPITMTDITTCCNKKGNQR